MIGRTSVSPLELFTSRCSTSRADAAITTDSSSCCGWMLNRTTPLVSSTSISHAWSDDDLAPVSTLALIQLTPRSGRLTHSRPPTAGLSGRRVDLRVMLRGFVEDRHRRVLEPGLRGLQQLQCVCSVFGGVRLRVGAPL